MTAEELTALTNDQVTAKMREALRSRPLGSERTQLVRQLDAEMTKRGLIEWKR